MNTLSKDNAWIWVLLLIFTGGVSTLILGALLGVYKKGAWYSKWYYWVLGIITVLPAIIMYVSLNIYVLTKVCSKLGVSGKEIYCLPYVWIAFIIVPIIGWVFFAVMFLYLNIWYLVKLYQGEGEKFIN